jgi:hypothetical protein
MQDDEDSFWLESINAERAAAGAEPVSVVRLEVVLLPCSEHHSERPPWAFTFFPPFFPFSPGGL